MRELVCTGTPVSWLRLERLALGELTGDEARTVEAHLRECAACRACAEECAAPVALPTLDVSADSRSAELAPREPALREPALDDPARRAPHAAPAEPVLATVVRPARFQSRARWVLPATLGLAAAAAVALVVLRPGTPQDPERGITRVVPSDLPTERIGATDAALPRRSDLSLTLLRERDGAVVEDPSSFLLGDRFAVQLTCRPGLEGQQRVAVYQAGEWSLPLPADDTVDCGNRVRVPGAFRLTEPTPADVCVLWGDAAEKAITAVGELGAPGALTEATCHRIEPVVPPNLR
ncbi:MAG: zf-HC2 domain-containing protein [Myxococcales bacterium]|nr:zf-HC2 domain-containing protein [Myxococcales bacterium]